MAAKRKSKKPAKTKKPAKPTSLKQLAVAAHITGLTQAQIKDQDEKDKKAGKKPLSLLATFLEASRRHIPKLEAEVAKRAHNAKGKK